MAASGVAGSVVRSRGLENNDTQDFNAVIVALQVDNGHFMDRFAEITAATNS